MNKEELLFYKDTRIIPVGQFEFLRGIRLDNLYDLIKADLVEKVEDEN